MSGTVFPSTYDSKCSACDEDIYEGDLITRDDDDNGWCHMECKDE